tara:strand:- start:3132 stop:3689 length:558 start_codon:yes stop_codon:yes gene_type:complete
MRLLNATQLAFHNGNAASNFVSIGITNSHVSAGSKILTFNADLGALGDTILTSNGVAVAAGSGTFDLGLAGQIASGVSELIKLHAFGLQNTIVSSGNVTGVANHLGQYVIMTGSGQTFNLPNGVAIVAGSHVTILAGSSNSVTVTATGGATINGGAANGSITVTGYNGVTCICIDASNNWLALGV